MKITVDARNPNEASADLLALPVARFEKRVAKLPAALASADRATRGQVRAAIASGDFQGKPDQSLLLYPDRRLRAKRVLLLGVGDAAKLDSDALRLLAGRCVREAARRRAGRVALVAPESAQDATGAVQALAEGALLAGYRFGDYRKNGGDDAPGRVAALSL